MTTDDEIEESSESDDENHQQRNDFMHQNEPVLRNRNSSHRIACDSTDSTGGAVSLANHLGDCFLSLSLLMEILSLSLWRNTFPSSS